MYATIVKYKTSYYTFCLPVFVGMTLAEVNDEEIKKDTERVLLDIGYYFQAQDDYLDCFGSEEVTGKIGTDIEDKKCTWLLTQALQLATQEQKQILWENIGKRSAENVKVVKDVYNQLNIKELYETFGNEQNERITKEIESAKCGSKMKLILKSLLGKIHGRSS